MGEAVTSALSVLTSVMTWITGNTWFATFIGLFIGVGAIGGLVSILKR